jgi:hypothetical protein
VPQEEELTWLQWAGRNARDLSAIFLFFGSILAVLTTLLYIAKDNTRLQKGVADMAGVTELRTEVANLRSAIDANTEQLVQMNQDNAQRSQAAATDRDQLRLELTRRMEKVESAVKVDQSNDPAIRYMDYGNSVASLIPGEPIRIGGLVRVTWHLIKYKDCGRPLLADFIIDVNGVRAQLTDVSSRDTEGFGVNLVPDPNVMREVSYTGRIPADKGLSPGGAQLTINASFDKEVCPRVAPVESRPIYFELASEKK